MDFYTTTIPHDDRKWEVWLFHGVRRVTTKYRDTCVAIGIELVMKDYERKIIYCVCAIWGRKNNVG